MGRYERSSPSTKELHGLGLLSRKWIKELQTNLGDK